MALDNNKLNEIFDTAANKAEDDRTTTLGKILALVREKFTEDDSFKMSVIGSGIRAPISFSAHGSSIEIADNGDGTLCINHDGQEVFNKRTPEEAMEALGQFYGRHRKTSEPRRTPPPPQPRGF